MSVISCFTATANYSRVFDVLYRIAELDDATGRFRLVTLGTWVYTDTVGRLST